MYIVSPDEKCYDQPELKILSVYMGFWNTELLGYTTVLTVESWGILKSLVGLACKQCETSDRRPYRKISVCPTPKIHVNRPIDIFLKEIDLLNNYLVQHKTTIQL